MMGCSIAMSFSLGTPCRETSLPSLGCGPPHPVAPATPAAAPPPALPGSGRAPSCHQRSCFLFVLLLCCFLAVTPARPSAEPPPWDWLSSQLSLVLANLSLSPCTPHGLAGSVLVLMPVPPSPPGEGWPLIHAPFSADPVQKAFWHLLSHLLFPGPLRRG